MKKYEILYDWPIEEIRRLADSDIAENYSTQLDEPEQSNFVALTEIMRGLGTELASARADQIHFSRWGELRSHVRVFGSQFASFPMLSINKLQLSIFLADKLSQSFPPLDDEVEINPDMFEIRELREPIPQSWFCRENNLSITDSIVIFPCTDRIEADQEAYSLVISPNLLFHFIATLNTTNDFPNSQAILVKKVTPQANISAINAFARLVVLATGKTIHSVRRYTNTPSIVNLDEIRPGEPYQQWGEILNVLSEYNSREDILLKFLTIYHVIENFMFKRPIVELERKMNGEMFSIRDFRRLYNGVEMAEAEALKKLFRIVLQMEVSAGLTFNEHLVNRWRTLIPTASLNGICDALTTIGLDSSFNALSNNEGMMSHFYKLVYAIRNTIVHNKETEFHLTYAALDSSPDLCSLIERFLLPSLEEICFALIGKPNSIFWYQNKEIQLYK